MKKISIIALFAGLLAAGCTPDLNNGMIYDKLGFSKTEPEFEVSIFKGGTDVAVIKSSKGFYDATAEIAVCTESEVKAVNDTLYTIIPSNLYSIDRTSLSFGKDDTRDVIHVSWNVDPLAAFCKAQTLKPVIPVKIVNSSIELDTLRSVLLIYPQISKISFEGEDIKNVFPAEKKDVETVFEGSSNILLDKAITTDMTVNVDIDNSLIAAVSEKRKIEYTQAPEGLITLKNNQVTIKAGELSGMVEYTVDERMLFNEKGNFKYDPCKFIAPVKVVSYTPEAIERGEHTVGYIIVNINDSGVVDPPIGIPVKLIHGPWEVVAGEENDMTHDPANDNPSWYQYGSPRLVDWSFKNTSSDNSSGYFCTWWWTEPVFPMEFVFDCGEDHTYIFNKFYKVDAPSTQGQLREFKVYVSTEYVGADTDWHLAAEGTTEYKGWQAFPAGDNNTDDAINNIISTFGYEIPFKAYTRGRFIKLVIVSKTDIYAKDNVKGGYLMEFFADGWEQ